MPINYLITGLPRSGTTLLTALLSENMHAVTFSEPEWLKEVRHNASNCQEFTKRFDEKILSIRSDIRQGRPVSIKISRFNRGLPKNYYQRNEKGEIHTDKTEIPVVFPPNYAEFPFIIKANAQFTSCLSELVKSNNYRIICLIRNPIATIMSWRSLDLPVSRGQVKVAEKYNKDFKTIVFADSLLDKQAQIVNWFIHQYDKYRGNRDIKLLRYEDVINNTEVILKKLTSKQIVSFPKLNSQNNNKYYNQKEEDQIKKSILCNAPLMTKYYHF